MQSARIGWINSVKGLTIVLVVAHHALLGLDAVGRASASAVCWDDLLAAIRMPLFFMVAGLFARGAIEGPFRKFADSKLLHFGYFYILWSVILFAVRYAFNGVAEDRIALSEIARIAWDPISTIWFMYALGLAFAVGRLCRNFRPWVTIALAFSVQVLALALPDIPYLIILNKCLHLFFFFFVGVYGSAWIRDRTQEATPLSVTVFGLSFIVVAVPAHQAGVLMWPIIYTVAALLGIAFVVSAMVVISYSKIGQGLAWVGTYSLPIYLVHFLPVAAIRTILLKLHVDGPVLIYGACIAGSIAAGIIAAEVSKRTVLRFLFERPRWAKLASGHTGVAVGA